MLPSTASQEMSKWTSISTRLVEPVVKKEPKWMELSSLDKIWHGMLSSYFFLYKPKSEVSIDDGDNVPSINLLIESLGKALVHFYPFAGRLIKSATDNAPRLYCNDEGALFTHKRYDGVASALIDENQFQPNELISGLSDIDPRAETLNPSGLPTLIIQVTDFQCGTRCLSVSWSHAVADGFSGSHFLASWAQISRGEPIAVMPVHNRSLLTRRNSTRILDGTRVRFLNPCFKDEEWDKMESSIPDASGTKTMKLSKRRIDELKAEGLGEVHGKVLSTANCVSSHLWRLITKLRKQEPHELTRFATMVNARSRLKDFPTGYFGNCIILASTVTTVGELLSNPLSFGATVIHDAINAVDEEVVRGWIDWFSVNEFFVSSVGDEPFMVGDPRYIIRHNITANWQSRFPFFDMDFGSGKPSAAFRNAFRMGYYSIGMFFALPTSTTSSQGDLSISLFAEKSLRENLCDQL